MISVPRLLGSTERRTCFSSGNHGAPWRTLTAVVPAFAMIACFMAPPSFSAEAPATVITKDQLFANGTQTPTALPDFDEIGGNDVMVNVLPDIYSYSPQMDIASNGDIFVAISVNPPINDFEIHVYRSQDGGQNWQLWGTKEDANEYSRYTTPSLHIAEGTPDRLFLAYKWDSTATTSKIKVSYCDPTLPSASFTDVTIMDAFAVEFSRPSIWSDEVASSGYYVFVAAEGRDYDGRDIWFARSRFQGDPWEEEYKIAEPDSGTGDYGYPSLTYGMDGQIHCAWRYSPPYPDLDYAIMYRRAVNFAGFGIDDWGPIVEVVPSDNDQRELGPVVAASHTSGEVLIGYQVLNLSGPGLYPEVFPSYDNGVTWNSSDITAITDDIYFHHVFTLPDGEGFVLVSDQGNTDNFGIRRAADATALSWSDHESFMDRNYDDNWLTDGSGRVASFDPTHDNRVAIAWTTIAAESDTLFFDAEWRNDPGFPNLEPGFPVALAAGVISPPGICELDGDPQSEIVFGDQAGNVHVVNHDGSSLPGWPRSVVAIPHDGPVAVGDLDGDGQDEVVAANTEGKIFVFEADGTLFPGWPVKLDYSDSAYVCIGELTAASHRQVVVCVGKHLYVLSADGSTVPGFPLTTGFEIRAPAAIGDVDNDGSNDIVILQEQFMNVITATGGVHSYRNFGLEGKSFSNAPTLADIDLDYDLEIVAPTEQGDVYVMHDDGTDFAGWPFTSPAGGHITSVALANSRSLFEPELSFASNYWTVHSVFHHGGELSGYPKTTGSGWYLIGMPIMDIIEEGSSSVIIPARDGYAYAWSNFGSLIDGWPVALPGKSVVSAASGDIDQDGKIELIFATRDDPHLVIYDLGADVQREHNDRKRYWPMCGYNAERQGCLACGSDLVTDVPEEPQTVAGLQFAAPVPNPSGAPISLRFELPMRAEVSLTIFDVRGRRVRQLVNTDLVPGAHKFPWDGRDDSGTILGAGIYYSRLVVRGQTGTESLVRKLILLP